MSHAGETTQILNEKRRRAVELRLGGASLSAIRAETGLSAPTVIGAYKAFVSGGWSAVPLKGLGRHVGQGRRLSNEQEAAALHAISHDLPRAHGLPDATWSVAAVRALMQGRFGQSVAETTVLRYLHGWGLDLGPLKGVTPLAPAERRWLDDELPRYLGRARTRRARIVWVGQIVVGSGGVRVLCGATLRGGLAWLPLTAPNRAGAYSDFMAALLAEAPSPLCVLLHGIDPSRNAALAAWIRAKSDRLTVVSCPIGPDRAVVTPRGAAAPVPAAVAPVPAAVAPAAEAGPPPPMRRATPSAPASTAPAHSTATDARGPWAAAPAPVSIASQPVPKRESSMNLTHLQRLEAEAIHIMREVAAEAEKPVMLYSIGKDSACMLRLAQKAFYPSVPPFPLLHVDTTWKFRDMYALRDRVTEDTGMQLLVYHNPEAKALGINPFDHGSQIHTDMWKTQGLKQALDEYGFDAAFGGARRDEEKSRAK